MLTFQISVTDNFGSVVSFNLKEDGDKIPVTMQNRQVHFWEVFVQFILILSLVLNLKEFVDLYSDFILNKGIDEAFKAFRRGFVKMTFNSPLSKWYSPEELEILLCGSNVLDWKSLEDSTVYDSGFENNNVYIRQELISINFILMFYMVYINVLNLTGNFGMYSTNLLLRKSDYF